jgi:hypothetical protein
MQNLQLPNQERVLEPSGDQKNHWIEHQQHDHVLLCFSERDFLIPDTDEKYVPEVLAYIHSYDVKVKQIPTEIATQTARVKK